MRPFIEATDADEILDALDAIGAAAGVRAFAVCPRHLVNREENIAEEVIFQPNSAPISRSDTSAAAGRRSWITTLANVHRRSR